VPKSGEFYTFEEVTNQLNIDEQKLKRLVSEGEIRAFREGDEMKFKKSDIDGLNIGGTEAETSEVDLSAGAEDASETLTDDLIFDEGDELDLSSDDAGMATAEISSQDTFVDEGGAPVGMSTEPLEFSEEGFEEELEEAETGEEIGVGAAGPRSRPARPGRRYEQPTGAGDLGWSVLLILSIIVMLFAGFAVWSSASAKGINSWSAVPVKIFDSKDYEKIKELHPTLGKDG
jgi:excisionase family DNA binding protein